MTVIYHLGTPGSPGTPDTVLTVDSVGWASGAISIPRVSGNGGYEFKVPATVVGAVCGIANSYRGVGYTSITHALYFSHGTVSLLEAGSTIQTLGSYSSSDTWIVYRTGDTFFAFKNGALVVARPMLFSGDFILAGALYCADDTIVDAKVINVARGSAVAEIGPIRALAMNGYANFGVVELSVSAMATAGNHGWASATIGSVQAKGGNVAYADADAGVGPLTAFGEQDALAPSWGMGSAAIGGLMCSSFGFTGAVGSGVAKLGGVKALAANKPYAEADGPVFGLDAFGAEALDVSFAVLEYGGPYIVRGVASPSTSSGMQEDYPLRAVLDARGGARAEIKPSRGVIDAHCSVPNVGRAELVAQAPLLDAAITISGRAQVEAKYRGGYAIAARGGAIAELYARPGYAVDASGTRGLVGLADLVFLGRAVVDAKAVQANFAIGEIIGPAPIATPVNEAWLVGPRPILYALASNPAELGAGYEAYAVNLKTNAVTRYVGFAFDNILRFGDRFFGVRADGVFELAGGDDNGVPIEARITTFFTDFDSANFKRVPWVYVVGRLSGSLLVTVSPAGGTAYSYPTVGSYAGQTLTHRARVGRGIKATRYSFTIGNGGHAFELDRVEAVVDVLTRAM